MSVLYEKKLSFNFFPLKMFIIKMGFVQTSLYMYTFSETRVTAVALHDSVLCVTSFSM